MDDFSANSGPSQEKKPEDLAGKGDQLPADVQQKQTQETEGQGDKRTLKRFRSRSKPLPTVDHAPKKKRFKIDRSAENTASPDDKQMPLPSDVLPTEGTEPLDQHLEFPFEQDHGLLLTNITPALPEKSPLLAASDDALFPPAQEQQAVSPHFFGENLQESPSVELAQQHQSLDQENQPEVIASERQKNTASSTDRYPLPLSFMVPEIDDPATTSGSDTEDDDLASPIEAEYPAPTATSEADLRQHGFLGMATPTTSDEPIFALENEKAPSSWKPVFREEEADDSVLFDEPEATPVYSSPNPISALLPPTIIEGDHASIPQTKKLPLAKKQKEEHDTSAQQVLQQQQKFSIGKMLCYLTAFFLVCLGLAWNELMEFLQATSKDRDKTSIVDSGKDPKTTENLPTLKPVNLPKVDDHSTNIGWFNEKLPEGMLRLEREGEYLWQKDSSIMVYVPSGPFWSGSEKKKNLKKIILPGYYIDKYELTNEQYLRFVQATGYAVVSPYFTTNNYNGMKQPVVGLNWYDASSYMRWSGKRMPIQSEWEKAARGGIMIPDWRQKCRPISLVANPLPKRLFPWGNIEPVSGNNSQVYANYEGEQDSYRFPAPVGSFALGVSPLGCYDMAGNVWEWCADSDGSVHGKKYCCGGSWGSTIGRLFCFHRVLANPNQRSNAIGIRFAY